MKRFDCGDVVPGCQATFRATDDDAILRQVAHHAHDDHGLTEVSADLARAVTAAIREAA